jgi:hypothetical protein
MGQSNGSIESELYTDQWQQFNNVELADTSY